MSRKKVCDTTVIGHKPCSKATQCGKGSKNVLGMAKSKDTRIKKRPKPKTGTMESRGAYDENPTDF